MQPQVRPPWWQCLGCSWSLLYKLQCGPESLLTKLCSRARDRVPFAVTGEASNAAKHLCCMPWCGRKLLTAMLL